MLEVWTIDRGRAMPPERFDQSPIRIGRSASNDVVLRASHVSSRHGEIRFGADGAISYVDLAAPNGSFVQREGELIAVAEQASRRIELRDGDELFFGDPAMSTCLRVQPVEADDLPMDAVDEGYATATDTGPFHVLTHLDVTNPAQMRGLSASFDRDALLALHEYGVRTARLRALPAIVREFCDTLLGLFGKASHVSVFLPGGDKGDFTPALTRTRAGDSESMRLSRTLHDAVAANRHAVTFTHDDPKFDAAESLRTAFIRAGICAPLWTGERIAGFVQIDGRDRRQVPFDEHDLEVVAVFANQLAATVENATLQADLEQTVADLRLAQSEMERLAFSDPLTGLSNRRLLRDRLEQTVKLARRQGCDVLLLYLDLDHFKRVNDSFGHDTGDLLLARVGERLRSCLRSQDTVARIGGDEFAAIVFDVSGETGAAFVARKLLDALREPIVLPQQSLTVTASIGLTIAPGDGDDVSRLLRNADLAMYQAKSRGRDTFHFFTEGMNREAARRLRIETEMRAGLDGDEFIGYYQPVIRVADTRVVGLEALVRWQHPQRGLTMPDEFIDVAEHSGIIVPLGERVLRDACLHARELAHSDVGPLRMAVNISARQFVEPGLPSRVERIVRETQADPGLLELEITESMVMEDTGEAVDRLNRLKDLGVSLCIDDFGTGYSSLSYLKRLPVDALKIDRSFVDGIPSDGSDVEITAAVIAMAHKLRLRVVAEGVSNEAQLEFLRENGCDDAQGYLFGEPRPLDALELAGRAGA